MSNLDGFMLYFKWYEHWIFSKRNNKRFVSLSALIFDNPGENFFRKKNFLHYVFHVDCMPQHMGLLPDT